MLYSFMINTNYINLIIAEIPVEIREDRAFLVGYVHMSRLFFVVPRAGIEPALPKELDFESSASTSSAIEAYSQESLSFLSFSFPVPDFQYFS